MILSPKATRSSTTQLRETGLSMLTNYFLAFPVVAIASRKKLRGLPTERLQGNGQMLLELTSLITLSGRIWATQFLRKEQDLAEHGLCS
jgi:hypothetical protein